MKRIETTLPEVVLLEPKVFGDARGFFYESWNKKMLADVGLDLEFVQDNHSRSSRGVLRGLHYQIQQPQGKLVRAVVVGPVARLELLPLDASTTGNTDILEAHMGAQEYREKAFQEGETLVLTPRKGRVFVA